MPAYLVRHAHAGSRSAWNGDDRDRPISDKGRRQADAIMAELVAAPIASVGSSRWRRCVETVEPLARARGLDVERLSFLGEGGSHTRAIAWLAEHAAGGVVACSHGDVIPKVIRRLLADGMAADSGALSQKGSIWVLDHDGERFVRGRYLPPFGPPEL